jgi:signal peptidase II
MEKEKKFKNCYLIILAILLIILDQWSKQMIRSYFGVVNSHDSFSVSNFSNIRIIGDFLQFTYVENEGMAFGISFGTGKVFLSLFSIFASVALMYYLLKLQKFSNWVRIGIMFIFTGAFGNLIDRVFYGLFFNYSTLFYGRVIDFIQVDIPDITIFNLHYTSFPIFNVADSCVTIGVVFLLIFHNRIPTFSQVFRPEIIHENDNINLDLNNQSNIDKS